MTKSKLIIIAGPNGAGKSTTSNSLVRKYGIESFDFDKEYYRKWSQFGYDPAVQRGVKESVSEQFSENLEVALRNGNHFSFETNYHTNDIIHYLDLADKYEFEKSLIFIGLKSIEISKARVRFRVENKGHFVPDKEIEKRYANGLRLLDDTFTRYDKLIIHESLPEFDTRMCIGMESNEFLVNELPSFIKSLPKLYEQIFDEPYNQNIN